MDKKKTKEIPEQKKGKEISFIKKCILFANIYQNKKKFVVNSFNNIPLVRLFTANLTDENFIYTKIKGALFLIYEEENDKTNFFLQIYDLKDCSLKFNLPINPKLLEDVIIEEKLICIPTKYYFLGFRFPSIESMKSFIFILRCEKPNSDININAKEYKCETSQMVKVIKNVKENLDKNFKNIDKENGKSNKVKNSFQQLDELYSLIKCIEYSEVNNKINIFIDKTINPFIIKQYINTYKNTENKNVLPYKIIFNDYNQIKSKKAYVGILVKNLINNFEVEKRLIVLKRNAKKKLAKEQDVRASAMIPKPKINLDAKPKNKNQMMSNKMSKKEEEEDDTVKIKKVK